jgi:hypothetical protein
VATNEMGPAVSLGTGKGRGLSREGKDNEYLRYGKYGTNKPHYSRFGAILSTTMCVLFASINSWSRGSLPCSQ